MKFKTGLLMLVIIPTSCKHALLSDYDSSFEKEVFPDFDPNSDSVLQIY